MCLAGVLKNRFSIWSPHPELAAYVSGNILTTLSFVFRWAGDINYTQTPLLFLGQGFTVSALLVLNGRTQFILDSSLELILPFWCSFCSCKSRGK